jgi:hypothetical protein
MTQTAYETDYPALPPLEDDEEETTGLTDAGDQDEAEDQDDAREDSADESADSGAGTSRAAAAKPNKTFIRRVAAKAIEIADAPESTRALAAALLGSGEDTVELTTAVMTAGRGAGQPLVDISEIVTVLQGDEPWDAGVVATSLDGARQKAVWNILYTRGAVGTPTPPKSLPKAGSAIVKAINGLTDSDKSGLSAAGDLLKRS